MNQVILLSGPAGAGKSTVAEALCERFDRMIHIEVDTLRHWVRAGYRHPWMDDEQTREQLDLAIRNASAVARESIASRYAVVVSDVIHAAQAARYRELLAGAGVPVHLVTLLPTLEVTMARDEARGHSIPDRVRAVHDALSAEIAAGELPGLVLDTSDDTDAHATADRVQDAVSRGAALLLEG